MATKIILLTDFFSLYDVVAWLEKKYLVKKFEFGSESYLTLEANPDHEIRKIITELRRQDSFEEAKEREEDDYVRRWREGEFQLKEVEPEKIDPVVNGPVFNKSEKRWWEFWK